MEDPLKELEDIVSLIYISDVPTYYNKNPFLSVYFFF